MPEEAARIKAKGGVVMPGGQRIISPSGRHSLNMSRALGDADYKTPRRIVSAVPDVQHLVLGCVLSWSFGAFSEKSSSLGTSGIVPTVATWGCLAVARYPECLYGVTFQR